MTTIKTNAGGSSDVTLDDGSQTSAKNTVTISGDIKFTNSVYSQVTLSDGKQTTAMNVVNLRSDAVTSVNGVQPVDGNVEITGDNITATVGEEEATITQHLTTLKNDEAELGEQVQGLQQSIAGKQDALTTEQLAAANSGITSAKVASYDAYAGEIAAKVNIAQGAENAGKVMTVGADGNVVPTAGYATESWVNQQIQTQIGTIETALAEV